MAYHKNTQIPIDSPVFCSTILNLEQFIFFFSFFFFLAIIWLFLSNLSPLGYFSCTQTVHYNQQCSTHMHRIHVAAPQVLDGYHFTSQLCPLQGGHTELSQPFLLGL